MIKNLVIVESPAKAKTIEKFLGKDYKVMSSYGHIRDLQKKNFSIDVADGFKPIYEIPDDKKPLVAELKKAASQAQTVWLASDEDREGEAIAWHLYEVLGLKPESTKRIVFHEITKPAILSAIEHPRDIDINLVDAQQARRVLDRIVGFELSPVLWKKIKPLLSAGRVQSVAVRLIVEREKEIKNFVSEPYYRIVGNFSTKAGHGLKADLSRRLPDADAARKFLSECAGAEFRIRDIQVRPVKKSPAPPFTTSTLQQEAARKLGFTVSQTMMVAQKLYEAGQITYMRTDSTNLSSLAVQAISREIIGNIGANYLQVRQYHTHTKGAQEAHEAIRPTYIEHATIDGTPQEKKLYNLIWKRAIASQMADAQIEKTTVEIQPSTRPEHFSATGEVVKFDGFLKVYMEGNDDDNASEDSNMLPPMSTGEDLSMKEIQALQRYTQQPPRYTEATLVKKMEELGIGRPSTYAPIISTIQQREYVEKGEKPGVDRTLENFTLTADGKITESTRTEVTGAEKGKLIPTDTGEIVNDFLEDYFGDIVDYNFTANVEEKFDDIAEGKQPWPEVLQNFYGVFHPVIDEVSHLRLEHKVGERVLGKHPVSGKQVSVKIGRFGPLVQIGGGPDDAEKPQFAALQKGQSIADITLDEALKLFDFPRTIGEYEGKDVTIGIGRFGPYVRHDGKFVSIPKTMSHTSITIEDAIDLIEAKRTAEKNKLVKAFDNAPDLRILNGRYGVYIAYKKENYKMPKKVADPAALTYDECMEIVHSQEDKPKTKRRNKK